MNSCLQTFCALFIAIETIVAFSMKDPFYGPPIQSVQSSCPPSPKCRSLCSVININGCNRCQCPSYYPCVFLNNKLPLGCLHCTPLYLQNGCVSSCNCTRTIGQSISKVARKFSKRQKRNYIPPNPGFPTLHSWRQINGANRCSSFSRCNTKMGCKLLWRWFKCPECICPRFQDFRYRG